jgi:hypothetical protein
MISFLLSTGKLLAELGMLIGLSFGVFLGVLFLLARCLDVLRKWLNK